MSHRTNKPVSRTASSSTGRSVAEPGTSLARRRARARPRRTRAEPSRTPALPWRGGGRASYPLPPQEMRMSCPAMSFSGVTREVYDCLIQQATTMGFPAPKGASGGVAYHNVEAEHRWGDEAARRALTPRAPPLGFPGPRGASGVVAYHNVEAEYRWDEEAGTLVITITGAPAHLG